MFKKVWSFLFRSRRQRENELIRHSRVRFLHYTPTLADSPSCSIYKNRGLKAAG